VLAFGTRVRGFKPFRSRRIFRAKKSSASRRSHVVDLQHVKGPKSDVEVATFGKILGNFLAHSSTFRCWGSLASFQVWETPGGGSWNVLITCPPGWGVWRATGNGTP